MTHSLTDVGIANLFTIECDAEMEHEGFRIQQAGITKRIGAELLAGNVYEVDPGKKLWPYHLHHANEEWLIVLRGRLKLRTPEGSASSSKGTWPASCGAAPVRTRYGTRPRSLCAS